MICPKCKSKNTIATSYDGDGKDYLEIFYECKDCGNQWIDITDDRKEE